MLKGALVVFGAPMPMPTNLIVFQYNPDEMTPERSARPRPPARTRSADARAAPRRVRPPVESFTISVELDAADQLETGESR